MLQPDQLELALALVGRQKLGHYLPAILHGLCDQLELLEHRQHLFVLLIEI